MGFSISAYDVTEVSASFRSSARSDGTPLAWVELIAKPGSEFWPHDSRAECTLVFDGTAGVALARRYADAINSVNAAVAGSSIDDDDHLYRAA